MKLGTTEMSLYAVDNDDKDRNSSTDIGGRCTPGTSYKHSVNVNVNDNGNSHSCQKCLYTIPFHLLVSIYLMSENSQVGIVSKLLYQASKNWNLTLKFLVHNFGIQQNQLLSSQDEDDNDNDNGNGNGNTSTVSIQDTNSKTSKSSSHTLDLLTNIKVFARNNHNNSEFYLKYLKDKDMFVSLVSSDCIRTNYVNALEIALRFRHENLATQLLEMYYVVENTGNATRNPNDDVDSFTNGADNVYCHFILKKTETCKSYDHQNIQNNPTLENFAGEHVESVLNLNPNPNLCSNPSPSPSLNLDLDLDIISNLESQKNHIPAHAYTYRHQRQFLTQTHSLYMLVDRFTLKLMFSFTELLKASNNTNTNTSVDIATDKAYEHLFIPSPKMCLYIFTLLYGLRNKIISFKFHKKLQHAHFSSTSTPTASTSTTTVLDMKKYRNLKFYTSLFDVLLRFACYLPGYLEFLKTVYMSLDDDNCFFTIDHFKTACIRFLISTGLGHLLSDLSIFKNLNIDIPGRIVNTSSNTIDTNYSQELYVSSVVGNSQSRDNSLTAKDIVFSLMLLYLNWEANKDIVNFLQHQIHDNYLLLDNPVAILELFIALAVENSDIDTLTKLLPLYTYNVAQCSGSKQNCSYTNPKFSDSFNRCLINICAKLISNISPSSMKPPANSQPHFCDDGTKKIVLLVDLLLQYGLNTSNIGYNLLNAAVLRSNYVCIRYLLGESTSLIIETLKLYSRTAVVDIKNTEHNGLQVASELSNFNKDMILFLLHRGADPSTNNHQVLINAIRRECYVVLDHLLGEATTTLNLDSKGCSRCDTSTRPYSSSHHSYSHTLSQHTGIKAAISYLQTPDKMIRYLSAKDLV